MSEGTGEANTNAIDPQIAKLQAELDKQRDLTQNWMGKATDYEKKLGGKSLEALIEAAKERDILATQVVGSDPKKLDDEINKRITAVREELGGQIKQRDEKLNQQSAKVKELLVVNTVFGEAAEDLYSKASDDFKSYIRAHCDIDENEQIIIKDGKGNQRYSPTNGAVPMTVKELITELKEQRDHWFVNKTPAGGKTSGDKVVTPIGKITLADLNRMDSEKQKEVLAKLAVENPKGLDELISQIKI